MINMRMDSMGQFLLHWSKRSNGWINRWIDGWMGKWMDEQLPFSLVVLYRAGMSSVSIC